MITIFEGLDNPPWSITLVLMVPANLAEQVIFDKLLPEWIERNPQHFSFYVSEKVRTIEELKEALNVEEYSDIARALAVEGS